MTHYEDDGNILVTDFSPVIWLRSLIDDKFNNGNHELWLKRKPPEVSVEEWKERVASVVEIRSFLSETDEELVDRITKAMAEYKNDFYPIKDQNDN